MRGNHGIPWTALLAVARRVVAEFPGWWVGVNCLGLEPSEVVAHVGPGLSGIWADHAGIDEASTRQPAAEKFFQARREHQWNGVYFGGVAFKYQREVVEVELAATIAAQYMDVVTTSGPCTGRAASPAKIAAMKRGTPGHRQWHHPGKRFHLPALGRLPAGGHRHQPHLLRFGPAPARGIIGGRQPSASAPSTVILKLIPSWFWFRT